jgi:hypothetical protein
MKNESLEKLVNQAKSDPKFFHDLVWNTERILDSISYLSREEKASILSIKPEDLVAGLATGVIGPGVGPISECGGTCGASCGGSCGASCGGSCTVTCAASCPATGLMPAGPESIINPAELGLNARELSAQIIQITGERNFSRFRR